MAVNIAKLAILLTADTSGMAQGFSRAEKLTRDFHGRTAMYGRQFGGLGRIASSPTAMLAGANIALARFIQQSAKWADQEQQNAHKIEDAYRKAREALGLFVDRAQFSRADSWSASVERMNAAAAEFKHIVASTAGQGHASVFGKSALDIAGSLETINAAFKPEWLTKQDAALKAMADKTKIYTEQIKAQVEAEKQAAEEAKKRFEHLQHRAQSISESLRTPVEIAADAMRELNTVFENNLITLETFNRGMRDAKDNLIEATKSARDFRDIGPTSGVGAVNRFSTAAFSAIQAAKRQGELQAEIARQQLDVEKRSEKVLEDLRTELRNRPATSIKVGRL